MSIAQRSVASEGQLRPADNLETPTSHDNSVAADLSTDATNLKWMTLRAEHRAHHVTGLPHRARAVLAALARTVDNARPSDKVFAGRDILQERAMVPERTFFRALTDLAEAGLIIRYRQWDVPGRAGWNRAYLALTEAAIALLGFNERTREHSKQTDQASAANDDSVQNLASTSAKVADPIKRDLYPASQKRQPAEIPADLQRLRDLGFHEFLIFKLMREAREQGKRLSDVINASWQHVKAAARPICYVRALLRSVTDFASLARYRESKLSEERSIQAARDELQYAMNEAAGKTYYDAAATRRIHVSRDGQTAQVHSLREPMLRVAAGAWQASFVAAVQAGQWVPATHTLETAFRKSMSRQMTNTEPTKPAIGTTSRDSIVALRTLMRGPRATGPTVIAA